MGCLSNSPEGIRSQARKWSQESGTIFINLALDFAQYLKKADREVVIAFPGMESYTAVLVRDKYFVGIIKDWFYSRISEDLYLRKG